jgi:hypothetical protein
VIHPSLLATLLEDEGMREGGGGGEARQLPRSCALVPLQIAALSTSLGTDFFASFFKPNHLHFSVELPRFSV